MAFDDFAQALAGDVRIDLRRRDIGMAQQGLHRAQIGPAFQQMGSEGVAKDVRADARRIDAGIDGGFVEQLPDTAPGQVPVDAARSEEKRIDLGFRLQEGCGYRDRP